MIYSGTSGLVLPVPQADYPLAFQGSSRLTYYASLVNSLEVNSSFYKNPKKATISKWVESVPPEFQFTFKLPKTVTHAKGLEFINDDIKVFLELLEPVGDRKGCLLAQFPASVRIDKLERLQEFLKTLLDYNNSYGWKLAIELRHVSLYIDEVYDLLDTHNVSLVLQDLPASATPLTTTTSDFSYLRFHGPGGTYRGSYTDDFLLAHAQQIKAWVKEGRTVYFYFNNTMGDAFANLVTLNSYINSSHKTPVSN